jgi:integrase
VVAAHVLRAGVVVREARAMKRPVYTVAEWAGAWQGLYPGRRNEQSNRHYRIMLQPFIRRYGQTRMADFDRIRAQKWAVRHPAQVKYLRLMFAKAVKAGVVDENVFAHVEVTLPREDRTPPTREQLAALVNASLARGGWWVDFADLIVFTAFSGARLAEVSRVQAADVLDSGHRVVLRGKRRAGEAALRVRTVAVFAEGVDALQGRPDVGLLWRSKTGRPLTRFTIGNAFLELAREVGYEGTLHSLRHFCASWLLDSGASRQDVAVQLGHVDDLGRVDETQVRERYGHVDVPAALARLEQAVEDDGWSSSGEVKDVEDGAAGTA